VTVTVPDSAVARGALSLATSVESAVLVRHSQRTYLFGVGLLAAVGRTADAEVLYVASLLHDLALGTDLDDGTTPFQLRGAGLAARFMLDGGRTEAEAATVYDAVAFHMDLASADETRAEVAGVHLGAALDVIGLRLDQLDRSVVDEVLSLLPATGLAAELVPIFAHEAASKPYSTAGILVRDFAFLDLIGSGPFAH